MLPDPEPESELPEPEFCRTVPENEVFCNVSTPVAADTPEVSATFFTCAAVKVPEPMAT